MMIYFENKMEYKCLREKKFKYFDICIIGYVVYVFSS